MVFELKFSHELVLGHSPMLFFFKPSHLYATSYYTFELTCLHVHNKKLRSNSFFEIMQRKLLDLLTELILSLLYKKGMKIETRQKLGFSSNFSMSPLHCFCLQKQFKDWWAFYLLTKWLMGSFNFFIFF